MYCQCDVRELFKILLRTLSTTTFFSFGWSFPFGAIVEWSVMQFMRLSEDLEINPDG